MTVHVLADDLTGANDTAVQFAKRGMWAATVLDPGGEPIASSFAVLAHSTESRGLAAAEAYGRLRSLLARVAAEPEDLLYKKVDSALRGNLGAEIQALLDGLPGARAVLVAPALPANGRTTLGGRQFLAGVPVHETEMARDPRAPIRQSHLPTLLSGQGLADPGYLPLAAVEGGLDTARDYLRQLVAEGSRVVVADAVTDGHLAVLARVLSAEAGIVPCGTAGLAAAWAGEIADRFGAARHPGDVPAPTGPLLAVVGSRSKVADGQVAAAMRTCPGLWRVAVDPADLSLVPRRQTILRQTIAGFPPHLARNGAVLLTIQRDLPASGSALDPATIADGLGEIAGGLVDMVQPGALFLTGGDTVAAVCRHLAARALELQGELAPGIIKAEIHGGVAHGLGLITKAGSFGDESCLARIVAGIGRCQAASQLFSEGMSP